MKKLSLLGLVCIIILAMVFCSVQSVPANQAATAQSQYLFDQPDMDLTRDFALLDGTLFYSTADGIYKTSLQQLEQRSLWLAYPDKLIQTPSYGKPSIYYERDGDNVYLNFYVFKLDASTYHVNQTMKQTNPASVDCGSGCYRDFGDKQALISWPNQFAGPNYVTVWQNDEKISFSQPSYWFGYRMEGRLRKNRLFSYHDKLYLMAFADDENSPENKTQLYELNCTTQTMQPLLGLPVDDFTVEGNLLSLVSHGKLYQYNLDTGQYTLLTACAYVNATGTAKEFLEQSSDMNRSQSVVVLQGNVFYVSQKRRQLCLLSQDEPICSPSVAYLRQEGNYIVAVLQTNNNAYETVIVDANGQVKLRLPMLAKVSIDDNTIIYSDGNHLYRHSI